MTPAQNIIVLPHGLSFKDLTHAQSKENLECFVAAIPERLERLKQVVRLERPLWGSDLSHTSLRDLGAWLCNKIIEREWGEEERKRLGMWSFLADIEVKLSTESIGHAMDVGIYVGECIRMRCPWSRWMLGNKEVEWRPVLGTFADPRSDMRMRHGFSPLDEGLRLAIQLVRNRRTPTHLEQVALRRFDNQVDPWQSLVNCVELWSAKSSG